MPVEPVQPSPTTSVSLQADGVKADGQGSERGQSETVSCVPASAGRGDATRRPGAPAADDMSPHPQPETRDTRTDQAPGSREGNPTAGATSPHPISDAFYRRVCAENASIEADWAKRKAQGKPPFGSAERDWRWEHRHD